MGRGRRKVEIPPARPDPALHAGAMMPSPLPAATRVVDDTIMLLVPRALALPGWLSRSIGVGAGNEARRGGQVEQPRSAPQISPGAFPHCVRTPAQCVHALALDTICWGAGGRRAAGEERAG